MFGLENGMACIRSYVTQLISLCNSVLLGQVPNPTKNVHLPLVPKTGDEN
jgi:hypothetical protein